MKNLIIDCFAGGGGASVGIEMALGRTADIAINHDPKAIVMHKTNHPQTLHLTEDIFTVDLQKYVGDQHVALMWASPDCRHFSKAGGKRPKSKSVRMLPWAVYKHAAAIKPDVIIMENVEEIQDWGPLDENGVPIPEKKGEEYHQFVNKMISLGYTFDSRELVAADYGAPTTRKRWYAIFRCDGKPIIWPMPTHSPNGENSLKKWIPASSVINVQNYGKSIFERDKPLADKTLRRIARGMKKFVFETDKPFIVPAKNSGNNSALIGAFITKFYSCGTGQSLNEPLHTITTSAGHFGEVSIKMITASNILKSNIDEITKKKCSWVSQFIIEYYGCSDAVNVNMPLPTIVTKDRFVLVSVQGNEYVITDICLRMLTPEELKLCQGFPSDYIINRDYNWNAYPKVEQVARIGNSVVPIMAKVLVEANCSHLKVGERMPNLIFETQEAAFA